MRRFALLIYFLFFTDSFYSKSYEITCVGFPRVVPTEGASALGARRRTLDCLAPAPPPRRGGSLRVARNPPPEKPPTMAFCKRRLSWPEVDSSVNSGYVYSRYFAVMSYCKKHTISRVFILVECYFFTRHFSLKSDCHRNSCQY